MGTTVWIAALALGWLPGVRAEGELRPRHFLAVLEEPDARVTGVVRAPFPCVELVPSWNLDAPPPAGVVVELAVARGPGDWSPWLLVGSWGLNAEEAASLRGLLPERVTCTFGRVDVDTFVADAAIDRARLRVRALSGSTEGVRLRRAAFCFTASAEAPPAERGSLVAPALDVPFRSQQDEDPELAPRACSPTSLAMVLAFHGCEHSTAEVAARAHDPVHDVYGNWSRAVQVAWSYGLRGHVARFSDWSSVARELAAGRPRVASIRAERGQLSGAPFAETEGHLLVVRGLDARGGVLVDDPAFPTASEGCARYQRSELERVWFGSRRGTAYVIEPASPASGR